MRYVKSIKSLSDIWRQIKNILFGQQRVLVELFDGYLVATAYVPKNAMKPDVEH